MKEINHDLFFAVREGQLYAATLLLDRGAEVNGKDKDGRTPLHYAAHYGHANIAALLLDRGAEVNVKDNEGWTPLELTNSLNRKIRNILVEKGDKK